MATQPRNWPATATRKTTAVAKPKRAVSGAARPAEPVMDAGDPPPRTAAFGCLSFVSSGTGRGGSPVNTLGRTAPQSGVVSTRNQTRLPRSAACTRSAKKSESFTLASRSQS